MILVWILFYVVQGSPVNSVGVKTKQDCEYVAKQIREVMKPIKMGCVEVPIEDAHDHDHH